MKRELLVEMGYEETVLFENPRYDEAIIGVTSDGNAVYDYELMVSELHQKWGGQIRGCGRVHRL